MATRTVLIDGDIVIYRCGFAAEHTEYLLKTDTELLKFPNKSTMNKWIKDNEPSAYEWTTDLSVEPLSHILATVKHMINNMLEECKADKYRVFLTLHKSFRDEVATILKYKGNRDLRRKPLSYDAIVKYLQEYHGAISVKGLEADDLLAYEQTEDTIIASIDKDLLQIPGKHYNFVTNEKMLISPETALRNKIKQVLVGDATDNIPGIYRVGPATADKILGDSEVEEYMMDIVYDEWDKYMLSDKRPEWVVDYDGMNSITYRSYTGKVIDARLEDLVFEVYTLIEVGDPCTCEYYLDQNEEQ